MDDAPLNLRLCRTMDVLVRFEKVPASLRDICKDKAANSLVRSLWKSQIHCERASATTTTSVYILATVEEELRDWASILPVRLREEVLGITAKLLISNLGTLGYRSQHYTYNPLPVLIACLYEILYDPAFTRVDIYSELQWHKESRTKVLHLLHKSPNRVQVATFACYSSPHYGLTSVPFSEKFILASCFNKLSHLKSLYLPNTCDDDILGKVADCCPLLEELDVSGSFGVTNTGMNLFCRAISQLDHSTAAANPVNTRIGYQATPLAQLNRFGHPHLPKTAAGQIIRSLKMANFAGTTIDHKGLEVLLSHCKNLINATVDDEVWTLFFAMFLTEDSPGCLDCVGAIDTMKHINMTSNVTSSMPAVLYLFPNLTHLVLNKPLNQSTNTLVDVGNLADCLPLFHAQTTLTLKDVDLDRLSPYIMGLCGDRITTLLFSGKSSVINIDHLDRMCPNLATLGITHATVLMEGHSRSRAPILGKLRCCKLWDIHTGMNDQCWKTLVKCALNIEKLYLWNIVITDLDLADIMAVNKFARLQDMRVGCSEIGFVRLTDDSVIKLVKSCPQLSSIGGICDWKTRDLLSLLQNLMMEGGWKITLEPQQNAN